MAFVWIPFGALGVFAIFVIARIEHLRRRAMRVPTGAVVTAARHTPAGRALMPMPGRGGVTYNSIDVPDAYVLVISNGTETRELVVTRECYERHRIRDAFDGDIGEDHPGG